MKQERNKENSTINAQFKQGVKATRKPKSMIPKPSSRLSTSKNARKGELQKLYIHENKNKEKMIPTKISSRRGSMNTASARPPKKETASKTEMLYQKARSALGKSKKTKGK